MGNKRKDYLQIPYSSKYAYNLSDIARDLGIPLKVIKEWRHYPGHPGWLSYPVTEDEFWSLKMIRQHIWRNDTLLKLQLAEMSTIRRNRLADSAGVPKPVTVARLFLLRQRLEGRRYISCKQIQEHVRGFCPNGYKMITQEEIKKIRKYVQNMFYRYDTATLRAMADVNVTTSRAYKQTKYDKNRTSQSKDRFKIETSEKRRQKIEREGTDWMVKILAGEKPFPEP